MEYIDIQNKLNNLNKIYPKTKNTSIKYIEIGSIDNNTFKQKTTINSEITTSSRKRKFTTKKESPKIIGDSLTFKDHYIYLLDLPQSKLNSLAKDYLFNLNDTIRENIISPYKQNYNEVIDRYINKKLKNEYLEKLKEFQTETNKLFIDSLDNDLLVDFKLAIAKIGIFKNATKKTAKIRKDYIISIDTLKKIQNITKIKLLELYEIGSPIEDIKSNDLFIISINNQIEEISKLRSKITQEDRIIGDKLSSAKSSSKYMKNTILSELLNATQTGKYFNINWSKLSIEEKDDRVYSYVFAVLTSQAWNLFAENNIISVYTLDQKIIDKISELTKVISKDISKMIHDKTIKYNNIKWKKQEGFLSKINSNIPIELTDDIKELLN